MFYTNKIEQSFKHNFFSLEDRILYLIVFNLGMFNVQVLIIMKKKTGIWSERPSRVSSLNPANGALQGRAKCFPSFSWDKNGSNQRN